jgi:hypothetical protein
MIPFSQIQPSRLKLKVMPKFPGKYVAGPGIAIAQSGGTVTTSVDFANLQRDDAVTPAELAALYVGAWDATSSTFRLYLGNSLKGEAGNTGPQGIQGVPGDSINFSTVTTATAATITGSATFVRTAGYSGVGDGGGGLYKKVGGAPTHPAKFQSADGAWWELAELEPNLFQFGATTSASNNATALQGLVDYCAANGARGVIPPGDFKVQSQIVISAAGMRLSGTRKTISRILANATFGSVFSFAAGANGCLIENMTIYANGFNTRCIKLDTNAVGVKCVEVDFFGDTADCMIYSNGDNLFLDRCSTGAGAATVYGIILDCYNQNTAITGHTFYGPGRGLKIAFAVGGGAPRVEGTRLTNSFFVNQGPTNVEVGNSLLTLIENCVLDQSSIYALQIMTGADSVTATGNYIGSSNPTGAIGVRIEADAGAGHIISSNQIEFLGFGVNVVATSSNRVSKVMISSNFFAAIATCSLQLDSVNGCTITGNTDNSTPSSGSWVTFGTHASAGSYLFDNNFWHTTAPAAFHTGSRYRWGNDVGIVGRNRGSNFAAAPATSFSIAHGLFRTPSRVLANNGNAPEGVQVASFGPTTFNVGYVTSGQPTIYWDAEV